MKPVLVLALGSPLAGDDDVAAHVLAALAADPAVADVAELVTAGTDLFRHADRIPGRERLVLVDAALSSAPAPRVTVHPHPPPAAETRRTHAHDLDPVAALELLRRSDPAIAAVPAHWLLVEVPELALGSGLSPAAAALVADAARTLRFLVAPA